jgi:hypothetical protein
MCLIVRDDGGVYEVRVITPDGTAQVVGSYGLRGRVRGLAAFAAVCDLFGRIPLDTDPEPYREVWEDVCADGHSPRHCSVQLVERVDRAGEDAPHGWREVCRRTPGFARRAAAGV